MIKEKYRLHETISKIGKQNEEQFFLPLFIDSKSNYTNSFAFLLTKIAITLL